MQLSAEDFDAYGEARARATAMSAPRGAVKRRLVAWMQAVAERLSASGIELSMAASDEHPSARNGHRVDAQTVCLFSDEAPSRFVRDDTQPESGHARIELRIDAGGVALWLRLGGDSRSDLEHAATMLMLEPEEVLTAWEALPPGLSIEARGSLSPKARPLVELGAREASHVAKEALESDVPLVIGVRATRAEALAGSTRGWSEIALGLGRLLHAIAWSAEGEVWAAERIAERRAHRAGKRAVVRATKTPDPPETSAKPVVDRGVHVRALAGPFAGQAGVVQELDGKGGARVLFGLLAARVELGDLAVLGKERGRGGALPRKRGPLLSSSHTSLGTARRGRKPTT
ncbi:MAG TPA: hypothetical protein VGH28_31215 [Polyangiaceae bacterium]|jgi:hypothetical protein